jgi:hypothetical protein
MLTAGAGDKFLLGNRQKEEKKEKSKVSRS